MLDAGFRFTWRRLGEFRPLVTRHQLSASPVATSHRQLDRHCVRTFAALSVLRVVLPQSAVYPVERAVPAYDSVVLAGIG